MELVIVKVQVSPVSRVTVTFPVEVTASENVTSMSIVSPALYDQAKTLEEILVIVGAHAYP